MVAKEWPKGQKDKATKLLKSMFIFCFIKIVCFLKECRVSRLLLNVQLELNIVLTL